VRRRLDVEMVRRGLAASRSEAAMAVGAASLLGSAFHDSVHISAAPKINMQEVVAFLAAGSVGFSKLWWRYKHVRLHHTYPGDPRYDPDIQFGPLARVTSAQQFRPTHKFQHIYIWVLLPFSTLAMLKPAELWQKRVFAQRGALDVAPSSARLIADKYSPFALFWAPIIFTWGAEGFILRYATFSLFVGAIVSITTQVQHNTELSCEGGNEAQRHPLAYQVFASADVRSNRLWWWMCGGANFHVVHHLAPSLSYLELPRVSERLEFLLDSHGYSYPAHRSLRAAVASHGRLLKAMSRNETLGGANNGK